MIRFFSPLPPLLKGWVFSFLAFGLLATVMVGQFALAVSMPIGDALAMAARDWLIWAILAPLLFRLVARLPLERPRWKIALLVHLLCAIATMALVQWWADALWRPPSRLARLGPARAENPEARSAPSEATEAPRPSRRGGPPGGPRMPFPLFFLFSFRFPIYLGIISVAHALLFYRRSQTRERRSLELEASLAKARLDALKGQLQPHLLFNTLNTIAGLVHEDPDKADAMLTTLSELLRMTLDALNEQELPLQREMEFVERYLTLLHARFEERLRFDLQAEPDARAALVPAMLLQPLVENAVEHGLQPKPGGGTVSVRARRDGAVLRLTVSDDGVGLSASPPPREGIGLGNTRARLRELYGDRASLTLRDSDGVRVEIALPFRTGEAVPA